MEGRSENNYNGKGGERDKATSQGRPEESYTQEQLKAIHEAMLEELGVGRMDTLPLADKGPRIDGHALLAKPAAAASNPWNSYVPDDVNPNLESMDSIADGQLYRLRRGTHSGLAHGFDPNGRGGGGRGGRGGGGGRGGRGGMQSNRGGHRNERSFGESNPTGHTPTPRGTPSRRGGRGGDVKRGIAPNYISSRTRSHDPDDGKPQFLESYDARLWGSQKQRLDVTLSRLRNTPSETPKSKFSQNMANHGQVARPQSSMASARQRQKREPKNPWARLALDSAQAASDSSTAYPEQNKRALGHRTSSTPVDTDAKAQHSSLKSPQITLHAKTQDCDVSSASGGSMQRCGGLGGSKRAGHEPQSQSESQCSTLQVAQPSAVPQAISIATLPHVASKTENSAGTGLGSSRWAITSSKDESTPRPALTFIAPQPSESLSKTQTADQADLGFHISQLEPQLLQQTNNGTSQHEMILEKLGIKLTRADNPNKFKFATVQVWLHGGNTTILVCTADGDDRPAIRSKITDFTTLFADGMVVTFCDGVEDLHVWSLQFPLPHHAKILENMVLPGGRNLLTPDSPSLKRSETSQLCNDHLAATSFSNQQASTISENAQQELLIDFEQDDPQFPAAPKRSALIDLCTLSVENIDSVYGMLNKIAGGNLLSKLLESVTDEDLNENSPSDDLMNSVGFVKTLEKLTHSFFSTSEIFALLLEEEQDAYIADICPKILIATLKARDVQEIRDAEETSTAYVKNTAANGSVYSIADLLALKGGAVPIVDQFLYVPTRNSAAQSTKARTICTRRDSQARSRGATVSGNRSRSNSDWGSNFEHLGARPSEIVTFQRKIAAAPNTSTANMALQQCAEVDAAGMIQTTLRKPSATENTLGNTGGAQLVSKAPGSSTPPGQADPLSKVMLTEVKKRETSVPSEASIKTEQERGMEDELIFNRTSRHKPSPSDFDRLTTQFSSLNLMHASNVVDKSLEYGVHPEVAPQTFGVDGTHSPFDGGKSTYQAAGPDNVEVHSDSRSSTKRTLKSDEDRRKLGDFYFHGISRQSTPAPHLSSTFSSAREDEATITEVTSEVASEALGTKETIVAANAESLEDVAPKLSGGLSSSKWATPQAPEMSAFRSYAPLPSPPIVTPHAANRMLEPLIPVPVQASQLPLKTVFVHDYNGVLIPVTGISFDTLPPAILPISPLLQANVIPARDDHARHYSGSSERSARFKPNAAPFSPRRSASGTANPFSPSLKANLHPTTIQERLTRSLNQRNASSGASSPGS